jgi:hypothetical protein
VLEYFHEKLELIITFCEQIVKCESVSEENANPPLMEVSLYVNEKFVIKMEDYI